MDFKNLLPAQNRDELRQWLLENHNKESECWVVVKRGRPVDNTCPQCFLEGRDIYATVRCRWNFDFCVRYVSFFETRFVVENNRGMEIVSCRRTV